MSSSEFASLTLGSSGSLVSDSDNDDDEEDAWTQHSSASSQQNSNDMSFSYTFEHSSDTSDYDSSTVRAQQRRERRRPRGRRRERLNGDDDDDDDDEAAAAAAAGVSKRRAGVGLAIGRAALQEKPGRCTRLLCAACSCCCQADERAASRWRHDDGLDSSSAVQPLLINSINSNGDERTERTVRRPDGFCSISSRMRWFLTIYPIAELWGCLLVSLLNAAAVGVVTPTLWQFVKDRDAASKSENELRLGALLSLGAAGQVLAGPLLCYVGHRLSFKLAFVVAVLASLVGELFYLATPDESTTMWPVYLGRFLCGCGAGLQALAQACIAEHTFGSFRHVFLGRLAFCSVFGFFLGPAAGVVLAAFVPVFHLRVDDVTLVMTAARVAPLFAFALNALALLVVLFSLSFSSTTDRIRLNHLRRMYEANRLGIDDSNADAGADDPEQQIRQQLAQEYFYQRNNDDGQLHDRSGWTREKLVQWRLLGSLLVIQFWVCSDITGFEPIVLLYSSAAYNFNVFDSQVLFACIGLAGLLATLLLTLVRRHWKSIHAEPALLSASLFALACAAGVSIDPSVASFLPAVRYFAGVAVFALAFPIALVECASVYGLSHGRRMRPLSLETALWAVVTGLARVLGPLWSVYFYTFNEDPLVFEIFALVGSFLSFALLIGIWRYIVDRQHLQRAIETAAILEQEAGNLIN